MSKSSVNKSLSDWATRINTWMDRWTAPARQIADPFDQRQAINALLVLPLTLIINISLQILMFVGISQIRHEFIQILLILHSIYLLSLTILARRGAYRAAAMGMYLGVLAVVILTTPYTLGVPERALTFTLLAMLIVTPVLRAFTLFLLAIVTGTVLATLAPVIWQGSPSYLFLLLLTINLLILVSLSWLRERDLTRILQSERRYRDLMQASLEMILIFDSSGPLLDANAAFLNASGLTLEELRQKKLVDLLPQDQRLHLTELWRAGEIVNKPGQIQLHLGKSALVDLEYRIHEHDYMGRRAYVAALRDVTAQKQAERDREERGRQYRSLFTQTSDAVFLVNMDGIIQTINHAALTLLGADEESQIVGRPHLDFVEPGQLEEASVMRQRIVSGENFPAYERTFRRLDGSAVICEINATVVNDQNGQPLYIQSAVRDLTERKRSEEQRFELALQLERVRLLEGFIEDVAHYFRTPMANIKTSLYLLPRFEGQPEKQAHQIEVMQSEVQRLERLLEDLLTVKRLEKEETLAHTQVQIEINALLDQLQFTHNTNLPAARWTLERAAQPLYVMGSPGLLIQVLENLMDNAEIYSTNGGALMLRCFGRNNFAIIEVQDEGMGIAAEELPRIFKNFYRSDEARAIRYSSSGLGLPIARKIIELHHGQIEAESELNKGSLFRVLLPRLDVPDSPPEPAAPLD